MIGKFLAPVVLVCILVTAVVFPIPAEAQSKRTLKKQLDLLQKQLTELNAKVTLLETTDAQKKSSQNTKIVLADLTAKLGMIETMLRQTNGRLEELEQRQNTMQSDLETMQKEMDQKITLLLNAFKSANSAGTANTAVESVPPQQKSIDTVQNPQKPGDNMAPEPDQASASKALVLPAGSDKEQYDFAFAFVRKQEFVKAEKALKQFIEANASSKLISNAHYWLGRVYQRRNMMSQAAQEFLKVVQDYASSAKYPDALIDLADVLITMDVQKDQACNLIAEYRTLSIEKSSWSKTRSDRLFATAGCQ